MPVLDDDLVLYIGATETWTFDVGLALAGASLLFTADRSRGSGSKALQVGPVTVALDGTVAVPVTAAASVNLRPSPSYTWDLWRIDGGLEEPVGLGRLDVRSSVRLP